MKTIEEATPILPIIIASNVETEVRGLLHHLSPATQPVESLVARAEEHFRTNKAFARKIRSSKGREWMYAFMRHWLAARLIEEGCPRELLPDGWVNGGEPQPEKGKP